MGVDSAAALGWLDAARGRHGRGGRALRAPCSSAGSAARTTTTRSGACAPRRRRSPTHGDLAARARRARRRCRRSPPTTGHPDALVGARPRARRDRARRGRRRRRRRTRSPARSSCRPTSRSRSSARRSRCGRASRSPPPASASRRCSGSRRPTACARKLGRASRSRRPRRPSSPASASRSSRRLGRRAAAEHEAAGLSRRELEVMRLVVARPHEPRDRPRAVPQPAHGRHARPQHPAQAVLPHPHRGGDPRRRARPTRSDPRRARRRRPPYFL